MCHAGQEADVRAMRRTAMGTLAWQKPARKLSHLIDETADSHEPVLMPANELMHVWSQRTTGKAYKRRSA